mgnify:CR=1 FL=1
MRTAVAELTTLTLRWMLLLALPAASALAVTAGWSSSATPTAAQLAAGKEAGEVALWASVRSPRARKTELWELKLFFKADDDMQEQLGLRRQRDQDDTFGLIAGIAVAGVVASSFIEASSLPPPAKLPLGAFCSLAPFVALVAGVAVPQELQGVVLAFRRRNPAYRQRQNYHEAGHFLVGYLLGLEIDRYNAASADGSGAEVSFVSPIASTRTHDAVDGVAVLAMAGIAAEVIACGGAEGGYTDVAQLRGMLNAALPPISTGKDQDDRIRWATLMALTMLQNERESLDVLAEQFATMEDVGQCIRALEAVARRDRN